MPPLSKPRTRRLNAGEYERLEKASQTSLICTFGPFPINASAFRLAWERLRKRADLCDLRFHDLRYEAISRFFEMGLSIPEVALISGHKDARMLFRHTHLKAKEIIEKLG